MEQKILDRFMSHIDKTDNCWIWKAYKNPKGYGRFTVSAGNIVMAHRFSYQIHIGSIPEGLVLDHLCENKSCVNPSHLEPVTNKENLIRGKVGEKNAKHHKSKTHCKNGHEYTEKNTAYWNRKTRGVLTRRCLVCYAMQQERFKTTTKDK